MKKTLKERDDGIRYALEDGDLSLVGRGCRFELNERHDIVFYTDKDERGQVEDVMKPHTPRQIVDMIKKQTKPRVWSKELRDWYVAEIIDLVRYNLNKSK